MPALRDVWDAKILNFELLKRRNSVMAQEWDIKPRGTACSACEKEFEDKQLYFSALIHDMAGYNRADFCNSCWEKAEDEIDPYSTWQGVFMLPPPKEEESLKKETAESLLRRLMEDYDEKNVNIVYILAIMLERKRIFVEKDVQVDNDGAVLRVYEHKKTGETFLIPDPQLELDKLEAVQEEVVTILGGTPPGKRGAESGERGAESGELSIRVND